MGKVPWCSPRARTDRGGSVGWPAVRSERRVGVELAVEVDARHLRAPRLHGSTREAPAEMLRGLRRSGNHPRQGIEVAEQLTGGGPRCNSGRCTGQGHG
jgi:hypothetical protein